LEQGIMEKGLKLTSININGLNDLSKRKRIFSKLEKQKPDIVCFQENKNILLVGIYAPNKNQNEFYKTLYEKLIELGNSRICIIGDYNAITNNKQDYASDQKYKKKTKPWNILPKSFFDMAKELDLVDAWRKLNPG
uniref:Endonuclease/exonuclease/phosphatase domain-containing protein n=1 Tax=Naja naja TaxID=35670 RepID=A0A8C6XV19_NAJNA